MKNPSILYAYPHYPTSAQIGSSEKLWLNHIHILQQNGFKVEPFCLTLHPPAEALRFEELDRMWKTGHKDLMSMYEKLEKALEGKDCLLNATGLNLHPEFVEKLPVFTVFQFNDDPENNVLSRRLAPGYDLCLVGNIAEVGTYKRWGIKHAEWMPIGLQPHLYHPQFSQKELFDHERDIDLFMMIDKLAKWRKDRLEMIDKAFPDAHFYGRGWSRGFLPAEAELPFLLRSKISPNIHNSTGPINYRTFYTPANGVLLICDNKDYLGKIYELGIEAIGFDSMEECIDLIHYYLKHDEERRWIAENGWKRAITDYSEVAVFQRTLETIEKYRKPAGNQETKERVVLSHLHANKRQISINKLKFAAFDRLLRVKRTLSRIKKYLKKHVRNRRPHS